MISIFFSSTTNTTCDRPVVFVEVWARLLIGKVFTCGLLQDSVFRRNGP